MAPPARLAGFGLLAALALFGLRAAYDATRSAMLAPIAASELQDWEAMRPIMHGHIIEFVESGRRSWLAQLRDTDAKGHWLVDATCSSESISRYAEFDNEALRDCLNGLGEMAFDLIVEAELDMLSREAYDLNSGSSAESHGCVGRDSELYFARVWSEYPWSIRYAYASADYPALDCVLREIAGIRTELQRRK